MEEQVSVGLPIEASDPTSELIELRQAEAVRSFDDEGVTIRNI